jgi:CRISPR-associated endonuclease/helicase Cas3
LWLVWVSDGVKKRIASGIVNDGCAETLFTFLAAAHDIGKAIPVFQAKNSAFHTTDLDELLKEKIVATGLPMHPYSAFRHPNQSPHALATQLLLEREGCDRNIAVILGAHHGKPPEHDRLLHSGIGSWPENYHLGEEGRPTWTVVQRELIAFALFLAGVNSLAELARPNMAAQVLLSGLVIMTDWIVSNEKYFSYIQPEDAPDLRNVKERAARAWERLDLPDAWLPDNTWMHSDLYRERFDAFLKEYAPNALQMAVAHVAAEIDEPGIMVIEAPMGMGKTEAALVAAEIFAEKAKRSGVFFALPTQATSDGMFPRLLEWMGHLQDDNIHSINLAHGKSQFNNIYQGLRLFTGGSNITEDEEGGALVHQWFEGRKQALLADFVVGTIDQLLMAALKHKHVMLRHLGLANKVVVIDECHAFDAYMSRYLERVLRWLGTYGVPVIVLSATLPASTRQKVIDAYRGESSRPKAQVDLFGLPVYSQEQLPAWTVSRAYPLVTYTDGDSARQEEVPRDGVSRGVELELLEDAAMTARLADLLQGGGCAGILVNTVKRAQELAQKLRECFGSETVRLLHSRFLAPDRISMEAQLRHELGKPGEKVHRPEKCIVVGTQVLEQSLDIDFDVLFTDFCPMDLLLQRIGRLHRHPRTRAERLRTARCLILGLHEDDFDPDTKAIYGDYLLLRTRACLPTSISIPEDIPRLVQDVYDPEIHLFPQPDGYEKAKENWERLIEGKERRADTFRVCQPWPQAGSNLVGWLNTDISDQQGEAAVRDSDESFSVLLVQERQGRICFLPWIEGGRELAPHLVPSDSLAQLIARQSVQLPRVLCTPWNIERTILELEQVNNQRLSCWQESRWLKGELFLILDELGTATLNGYRLHYDQNDGLSYQKEVWTDG